MDGPKETSLQVRFLFVLIFVFCLLFSHLVIFVCNTFCTTRRIEHYRRAYLLWVICTSIYTHLIYSFNTTRYDFLGEDMLARPRLSLFWPISAVRFLSSFFSSRP